MSRERFHALIKILVNEAEIKGYINDEEDEEFKEKAMSIDETIAILVDFYDEVMSKEQK